MEYNKNKRILEKYREKLEAGTVDEQLSQEKRDQRAKDIDWVLEPKILTGVSLDSLDSLEEKYYTYHYRSPDHRDSNLQLRNRQSALLKGIVEYVESSPENALDPREVALTSLRTKRKHEAQTYRESSDEDSQHGEVPSGSGSGLKKAPSDKQKRQKIVISSEESSAHESGPASAELPEPPAELTSLNPSRAEATPLETESRSAPPSGSQNPGQSQPGTLARFHHPETGILDLPSPPLIPPNTSTSQQTGYSQADDSFHRESESPHSARSATQGR
jgi:hypothetical protein